MTHMHSLSAGFFDGLQFGSVGEWVGGIGSLGAAVTALGLAFAGSRNRRSQQAKRVSVVFEYKSRTQEQVTVRNGSELPIFRVAIPKEPGWLQAQEYFGDPWAQGDTTVVRTTAHSAQVVDAGASSTETVYRDHLGCCEFQDANGLLWRRSPGGELQRITHRELRFHRAEMGKVSAWFYRVWSRLRGRRV